MEIRNEQSSNINVMRVIIILFVVFLTPSSYSAQTKNDSLEVHQINGKNYYIHVVEKGNSLYSIHKKYDVPLAVIKKENPSVLDGLSIGEKIFIPVKKNEVTSTKIDGNYINHKVEKKQTLYSIAKIYKVKQNKIALANPEITDGLKEGTILRIPILDIKSDKVDLHNQQLKEKPNYDTHLVKKGETFYSLSKLYKVSIDSIKIVNQGLKRGLKVDETIFIPIKKTIDFAETNNSNLSLGMSQIVSNNFDSITRKNSYKIGLMLPFYLDENDEITDRKQAFKEKGIYPRSKFAIEFYNGFLLALDSLASDSLQFELYVYDTKGKDSIATKKILLKNECKTLDLIVGPLYKKNFERVSAFAKENHIPITSPVKQNNKILLGNPYVFKAIPSKPTTIQQVVTLVVDSFKTDNLMAIEYSKSKENSLVPIYVKGYNKHLEDMNDTLIYSTIKTLNIDRNYSDIVTHFKSDRNNVLFIPVVDQTYITNLFNYLVTILSKNDYKNYQVTIIGQEEWLNYENIDLEYFQKLNVHLPVTQYINYSDSMTNIIVERCIKKLGIYPSKNTMLGYDLAYFFGDHFKEFGTLNGYYNSLAVKKGISLKADFQKTGLESGYENKSTCILKFDDYTLMKVY